MTAMTTTTHAANRQLHYARKRAQHREAAAMRLAARVVHPVITQLPAPASASGRLRRTSAVIGFGVLALLIHGVLAASLLLGEKREHGKRESESVQFRVVENAIRAEQSPPPDSVVEPEPDVAQEPEQTGVQELLPQAMPKATPQKRIARVDAMAKSDPVNRDISDPAPAPKKRAVVGITMESTVKGGGGPAYAVGNSRMGTTQATQTSEKIEPLAKGSVSGNGGSGADVAAPANRTATFIPTVSSDFTRPKRISEVELPYPPALKSKGIEGNVMVLIVINEQGVVQKVRILKSSGYREFDEAALKAAQKEVYSPALRDGKAVEYNLKYTYRFRITGA